LAGAAFGVADHREFRTDLDGLVLRHHDPLQHACRRGGDLGIDLVGGHLDQGFVDLDGLTLLFEPTCHRSLGDTLAERGHLHRVRHLLPRLLVVL
jgi:hypothetical protein